MAGFPIGTTNGQLHSIGSTTYEYDSGRDQWVGVIQADNPGVTPDNLSATNTPSAGQVPSFVNGTNFEWSTPSSGSAVTAIAERLIAAGDLVVVNDDGTVSAVTDSVVVDTESITSTGTETTFHTSVGSHVSVAFSSADNGQFVVVWRNSVSGQYRVGTLNEDGTITLGATAQTFHSNIDAVEVIADPHTAGRFVILYNERDNGGAKAQSNVITGEGTTAQLSAQSLLTIQSGEVQGITGSFDPRTAGRFMVAYRNGSNGNGYVRPVAIAADGTFTNTFTSEYSGALLGNMPSSSFYDIAIEMDPNVNDGFLVAWATQVTTFNRRGYARYGVLSSTNGGNSPPNWRGSETNFNNDMTSAVSLAFDSGVAGRFVISYRHEVSTSAISGRLVVGTVGTTTTTYGAEQTFRTSSNNEVTKTEIIADPGTSGRFALVYRDGANSNRGTYRSVSLSNSNAVTFGNAIVYDTENTQEVTLKANSRSQVLFGYVQSSQGRLRVGQLETTGNNLTASNFIGISSGNYASGAEATISTVGAVGTLSASHADLTPRQDYYVRTNNTLANTAGTPSVYAGTAVSTRGLLIKGPRPVPAISGGSPVLIAAQGGLFPPGTGNSNLDNDVTFSFSNIDTTKPLYLRFLVHDGDTTMRGDGWEYIMEHSAPPDDERTITVTGITDNASWTSVGNQESFRAASGVFYATSTRTQFAWLRHPTPAVNQTFRVGSIPADASIRDYYLEAYQ